MTPQVQATLRTTVSTIVLCGMVVLGAASAKAQITTSQTFRVVVPSVMSLTTPQATLTETHTGNNNNFVMTRQQWVAISNAPAGANITFTLTKPFLHTTLPLLYKRDARMTVSVDASGTDAVANWLVIAPIAVQTGYLLTIPINQVSIVALSTGPGKGTINVDVEFLTNNYSTLLQGTYETVVTATIAAN